MDKLVGVRWGDLKEETKEYLIKNSLVWGDIEDGECTLDITADLSVSGYVKCINKDEGDYEYTVDDDAIIYNPEEGILTEKKEINFEIDKVLTVTEAAEIWGIAEGTIRAAIRCNKFILGFDYRKAGRITLITKSAMERVYGELK